ncbi:mechanosensitive ion channel family protein [Pseudaestuariivita atlantica]|uniref:Mechanosensitive ion channel protein n=1 Tax=Pseudaestuariivita atlantica TaxID=1317121 RepID=A0A0L1JNW6_9RHOB|nr:mechanosensitive ion channel domain-containing protein [Pseudaestuariivita atlantica]KNG93444.1 mechanosensitive ion channel protein [Pseudaestuariivita atlantica]
MWDQILALWVGVENFVLSLAQPGWRLYQVLIILGIALVAWGLHRVSSTAMNSWVRAREGWTPWQLRGLVQVRRRLGLIWFSLMSWTLFAVMQQVTWPSRSYLIGLAATLATAWIAIALASALVRNRFLRRLVKWVLWIYVTLFYLGISGQIAAFLDGLALSIGSFHLSVLDVLLAIAVIGVLFTGARILSGAASASIKKNEDISPSMQVLAVKVLQLILYTGAFFIGLRAIGIDLTGLAVLSGAIGVGLGFGLQKVVSNLVSGVIILLDKSIKPGDVISLGDTFGWIQTLGARYASVVTRDGKEYLIPNEDLITGQVVNWSHSNDFVRLDIYFGTSYGDDPHKVRALAIEAAKSVERVLTYRAPVCHIVGFGDSSVDYILRFWIRDPTAGLTNIRGNVYLALWDAFQANGISIPFPQREVRMLNERDAAALGD